MSIQCEIPPCYSFFIEDIILIGRREYRVILKNGYYYKEPNIKEYIVPRWELFCSFKNVIYVSAVNLTT